MVSYIDSYKVPNTVGSLSHVSETFWKDNKVNFFEKACHGDKAWGKIAIGISLLAGVIFVLYNKWHDIQHYMPFTIAGKVFYHFKRDEILFTNLRSSIQNKGLPGAQVEIQKWLTDRAKLSPSDFSLDLEHDKKGITLVIQTSYSDGIVRAMLKFLRKIPHLSAIRFKDSPNIRGSFYDLFGKTKLQSLAFHRCDNLNPSYISCLANKNKFLYAIDVSESNEAMWDKGLIKEIRKRKVFIEATSKKNRKVSNEQKLTEKALKALAKFRIAELDTLGLDEQEEKYRRLEAFFPDFIQKHRLGIWALKDFDFEEDPRINDAYVKLLAPYIKKAFKSLMGIDFSGCNQISDKALHDLIQENDWNRLFFTRCPNLTDQGLLELSRVEGLEEVSLGGSKQISDQGLVNLAQKKLSEYKGIKKEIKALTLDDCPTITAEALTHFTHLEKLVVRDCPLILATDLEDRMSRFSRMSVIEVTNKPEITDSFANKILSGQLTRLNLSACTNLTDELCVNLETRHSTLRFVDLSACPKISDRGTKHLLNISTLQELRLSRNILVGDKAFSSLENSNLQAIYLRGCLRITDVGIKLLMEHAPHLTQWFLGGTSITGQSVQDLVRSHPGITILDLSSCKGIKPRILTSLHACEHLESLFLQNLRLDEMNMAEIVERGAYTRLKTLDISYNKDLTESSLKKLGRKKLTRLAVAGCVGFTDEVLSIFRESSIKNSLTYLNISKTSNFVGWGIKELKDFTQLRKINLNQTRIKKTHLMQLAELVSLKELSIKGCENLSDHDIESFRREAPWVRIEH